jgi:hypothetical protein
MGAERWSICPKCLAAEVERVEAEERRVAALYGTVPLEEYEAERDKLEPVVGESFATFREDWEFTRPDSGTISVSYGGGCRTCGLGVTLTAEKTFFPEPT